MELRMDELKDTWAENEWAEAGLDEAGWAEG